MSIPTMENKTLTETLSIMGFYTKKPPINASSVSIFDLETDKELVSVSGHDLAMASYCKKCKYDNILRLFKYKLNEYYGK